MSPFIAFKIFKHQPERSEKRDERSGLRFPVRLAKHIVRRLRHRVRRVTKAAARPDQTRRSVTGIDRPAIGGTAK